MKLSAFIGTAQHLLNTHGDLEILDQDMHAVDGIFHEVSSGEFDEDWNLPAGAEYIQITSNR